MPSDIVDVATRSRMMAGIRGKNTRPEMIVRQGLHAAGFRFRLHDRKLAGAPDLVLPRYRTAVFVNGCFWHGHDCPLFRWPKTRQDFWRTKITGNVERDGRNTEKLRQANWRILTIWECALKGPVRIGAENVVRTAAEWLKSNDNTGTIRGAGDGTR